MKPTALIMAAGLLLLGFQGSPTIDRKQLKEMLIQLGYETKDLVSEPGKEKYEFTLSRGGLDVPIGAEISASNNFVWLTCYLGDKAMTGDKAIKLLQRNGEFQPSQFYLTKSGKLMFGVALENRGLTNAILRTRAEKIAEDVAKSQADWQ